MNGSSPPDEQVGMLCGSPCHQCMNVCECVNVTCNVKELSTSIAHLPFKGEFFVSVAKCLFIEEC